MTLKASDLIVFKDKADDIIGVELDSYIQYLISNSSQKCKYSELSKNIQTYWKSSLLNSIIYRKGKASIYIQRNEEYVHEMAWMVLLRKKQGTCSGGTLKEIRLADLKWVKRKEIVRGRKV